MQNRTDIVGVSLWERLRQAARGRGAWLVHAGCALMGFVLSGSQVFGGLSPFGVAFCAALPPAYTISGTLGAVLGYAPAAVNGGGVKYIAALLIVWAAKWLLGARAARRFALVASSVVCFAAMGIASAAMLAVMGDATVYDVTIAGAEVFLASGAAYFFTRTLRLLDTGLSSLGRSDISCIIIAMAIVLMGLSAMRVFGVSAGRSLAALIILICSRHGREAGGAVSGVTAGMALGLANGNTEYVVVTYALGGLVCGVFGGMGRIAAAASLILTGTVTALFTMNYADVYNAIFELFVATLIFVAIPDSWISRWGLSQMLGQAKQPDTVTQTALCERLDDISTALSEIGATTRQVSERLGTMEQRGLSSVYTRTADQVCAHCGLRTSCWQFRQDETTAAMDEAMSVLKRDGTITREKMPKHFQNTCCKPDEFVLALNARFTDMVAKEGVQRKVSKVRGVVTDQFEGIALMLSEISGQLGGMRLLDAGKTKLVRDYLERQGLSLKQVICFTDEHRRISVEIHIPGYQVARISKNKLALDLCALLEADFDEPQITVREQYTVLLLSEKASLSVAWGVCQLSAGKNRLCGDAYDFIRCPSGKAHLILSDGMGNGGSAAVDSAMASGLIGRLLSVGIGHDAALKMVNSALLIKSGEESLATIDICSLDLFTGKASFYKAGAAPTFVVKKGRAGYVESTSLPVGILRGVAFEKSSITLHEGDIIVMVSDGVVTTGADWVVSELETVKSDDMQRICERLATTAKLRRADGREDDVTVLAAVMRG